jgi:Serine aminopeptidase, S33
VNAKQVALTAKDGNKVLGTYRDVGSPKAAVLLVHGITADRHEWGYYDLVGEAFQRISIASLAIDYRGHGESELPIKNLMLSGMMLDIDIAWRYLLESHPGPSIRRAISGNSFGGGISYIYGMWTESVNHVFLTMPVLSYTEDISRVNPDWERYKELGYINYSSVELPGLIVPEFYFFDEILDRQQPTKDYTILHGRADSDVPFEESIEFCHAHPRGRLIGLDDMDHSWAAPGDPERETLQSRENQATAAARFQELVTEALDL